MCRGIYLCLFALAACGSTATLPLDGPFVGYTPTSTMFSTSEVTPSTSEGFFNGTLGSVFLADDRLVCSDNSTQADPLTGTEILISPVVFSPNSTFRDVSIDEGTYNCDPNTYAGDGNDVVRFCSIVVFKPSSEPNSVLESISGFVTVSRLTATEVTLSYGVTLNDGNALSGHITAPYCNLHISLVKKSGISKTILGRERALDWLLHAEGRHR